MLRTISVSSRQAQEMIDITAEVARIITAAGVENGVCHLAVPHTTAGVTINENCDPDVQRDILVTLERLIPVRGDYRHVEGNSHAHIKTSLMGNSATVIVQDGRVLLGTWQGIFFCEFDGPRNRQVTIKIQPD